MSQEEVDLQELFDNLTSEQKARWKRVTYLVDRIDRSQKGMLTAEDIADQQEELAEHAAQIRQKRAETRGVSEFESAFGFY